MHKWTRPVAASMAAVLTASSFIAAGCSRKNDSVVQADSPWYDLQKVTIGWQSKDDDAIAAFDMYYTGRVEDLLVFSSLGYYRNKQATDNYLEDIFTNSFEHIDVYDLEGTLINSIDLLQFMQDEDLIDMDAEYSSLGWGVYIEDGKIAYEYDGTRYLMDPSTGEYVGSEQIPAPDTDGESYGSFEVCPDSERLYLQCREPYRQSGLQRHQEYHFHKLRLQK